MKAKTEYHVIEENNGESDVNSFNTEFQATEHFKHIAQEQVDDDGERIFSDEDIQEAIDNEEGLFDNDGWAVMIEES